MWLAVWLTTSAWAQSYGGGGVTLHQAFVPYVPAGWGGQVDLAPPGLMGCVGGVGYRVEDGARLGGTGSWCTGPRSRGGFGGLQGGWQTPRAGLYGTVHATLGFGHLQVEDGQHQLQTGYVFVRPTAGLGVPVGRVGAVEGGLFVMAPFPVQQRLDGRPTTGSSFPHVGLELSLLLGDFSRQRKRHLLEPPQDQEVGPVVPPPLGEPERPAAPPPPPPPAAPAPVQPGRVSPRPLAIPQPNQPRGEPTRAPND